MCIISPHVPIVIYYPHKTVYVAYFGWDVKFINGLHFWKNMYHPFFTYQENKRLSFR